MSWARWTRAEAWPGRLGMPWAASRQVPWSQRSSELFRTKVRDNDPALADREPADRTVHWWRRTWPGHTRAGYPSVALVVTDAGPLALANRQEAVADLSAECWHGSWWTARLRATTVTAGASTTTPCLSS